MNPAQPDWLAQLAPAHAPPPPGWWPLAPGWWAVMILIIGFLPGFHIDNAAHIGGLAAGFGIAYIAGEPGRVGSSMERVWRVAASLSILITVVCFLKMYLSLSQSMQQ